MMPNWLVLLRVAEAGPLKTGWLNVLKVSMRSFNCWRSDFGSLMDFSMAMSTEEKPGPRASFRVPVPPPKGNPTAATAADWLEKYCKSPAESAWMPGLSPGALSKTAGASSVNAVGKELVWIVNG